MKKELCAEERALSYAKYFYLPLEKPNPLAMQLWRQGPMDPGLALKIEDINELFSPGYLPAELGYCALPENSGFIANYVRMEGVTVDMFDWWFVWHFISPPSVPKGNGNLRYKLWNPEEHWDTGSVDEAGTMRRLDESLHYRLRNVGSVDYIVESLVGDAVIKIEARPVSLEALGADPALINAPGFGTYVAASSVIEGGPGSIVVHYCRPVSNGVELRSRYWYGYKVENGRLARDPDSPAPSPELLKNSCMHNMVEYPRLGRFLPGLYREEAWKPVGAY